MGGRYCLSWICLAVPVIQKRMGEIHLSSSSSAPSSEGVQETAGGFEVEALMTPPAN